MNPNIDKLPAPGTNPAGIEIDTSFRATEKAPSKEIINASLPQATIPQTTAGAGVAPQTNPIVPAASAATTSAATTVPVTESDEEFEKKWVDVAKAIVERTKNDPRLQSQELSKTGKDYREKLQSRS